MLHLNYLFSKYLLTVKGFGSLRERRYISVHYYYYYYYYYSSHPRHFNYGVPPSPPRGIDTADRSSLKYFATPTGAEKRTLSEMQRRRFQNVQEDEGEMKRDSIHDLLLRELTRGENTGKQLITFRLQQAHSFCNNFLCRWAIDICLRFCHG